MKIINKLPKFMPGQVIDLSYRHKGLPNRLLIKTVLINEHDDGWMYHVYLENIGECTTLDESFISGNCTSKTAQVYKCAEIIKLYADGWRFCGNYNDKEAYEFASKCATNRYIKDIILRPALDYRGCLMNGKKGMWLRYRNFINDDGTIIKNESIDKDIIVIK